MALRDTRKGLPTCQVKITYQQAHAKLCEAAQTWYFELMSAGRIDQAMSRINAALARIDAVRLDLPVSVEISPSSKQHDSARVMALVNAHEKLREEVADTIGELDTLIMELEGE